MRQRTGVQLDKAVWRLIPTVVGLSCTIFGHFPYGLLQPSDTIFSEFK